MELAASEARQLREQEQSRKRQLLVESISSTTSNKRRRIELVPPKTASEGSVFGSSNSALASDVEKVPLAAAVEVVISTLQGMTELGLNEAIEVSSVRAQSPSLRELTPSCQTVRGRIADHASRAEDTRSTTPHADPYLKVEPIDPLKLDLGAEELEMKAEVAPAPEVCPHARLSFVARSD